MARSDEILRLLKRAQDTWDQITPVEEVMRGLDDLVRAGKVLYVGISDAPAWWIACCRGHWYGRW